MMCTQNDVQNKRDISNKIRNSGAESYNNKENSLEKLKSFGAGRRKSREYYDRTIRIAWLEEQKEKK